MRVVFERNQIRYRTRARLQGGLSGKPADGTEGRGYDGRRLGSFVGFRRPARGEESSLQWETVGGSGGLGQAAVPMTAKAGFGVDAKASKLPIGWSRRGGARDATWGVRGRFEVGKGSSSSRGAKGPASGVNPRRRESGEQESPRTSHTTACTAAWKVKESEPQQCGSQTMRRNRVDRKLARANSSATLPRFSQRELCWAPEGSHTTRWCVIADANA